MALGNRDKFRPLWHHYYQDKNGLIHVVDSSGRDRVEEAEAELIKMTNQNEMNVAVVFVFFANTRTPSAATRLGKMMTDVRKNGKLWWWYADGAGGDSAVAKGKEYQQVPPWVVLFFLSMCVGGWFKKRSEKSTIRMRIVIPGHNNCKCLLNSMFRDPLNTMPCDVQLQCERTLCSQCCTRRCSQHVSMCHHDVHTIAC